MLLPDMSEEADSPINTTTQVAAGIQRPSASGGGHSVSASASYQVSFSDASCYCSFLHHLLLQLQALHNITASIPDREVISPKQMSQFTPMEQDALNIFEQCCEVGL